MKRDNFGRPQDVTATQPISHDVLKEKYLKAGESGVEDVYRRVARALASVYQATVPWCSVLVRRAFGVAGAAHQSTGRFNLRYAWPSGEWGSLPIAGAAGTSRRGASADRS